MSEPMPKGLRLVHEHGRAVEVHYGQTSLLRYVYEPWDAQMEAPRRVEERRELGAPVALPLRRDRRELLADVLGGDHRTVPSSASRRRLTSMPASP